MHYSAKLITHFIVPGMIIWCLAACIKQDPIAYRAQMGMTRKEVERVTGNPLYKGGFVASVDPGQKYTSSRERSLLFYVYTDSSLVVFRKNRVVERRESAREFLVRLQRYAKFREQRRQRQLPVNPE